MSVLNQEQIYLDYKEKVTHYVRSKVSDQSIVEDLVSDIFLKIFNNLDRYDPEKAALSTWVYTITSRKVLDYYRTRKVFSEIPSESGEEGVMPEALISYREPDEELLKKEQLASLADALEQLPERERSLLILHYYHNLTLKATAQKLGMSYANVKIVHKKALAKLRSYL